MIVEDNIFRQLDYYLCVYGVGCILINKATNKGEVISPEDVRRKVSGGYIYNGIEYAEDEIIYMNLEEVYNNHIHTLNENITK